MSLSLLYSYILTRITTIDASQRQRRLTLLARQGALRNDSFQVSRPSLETPAPPSQRRTGQRFAIFLSLKDARLWSSMTSRYCSDLAYCQDSPNTPFHRHANIRYCTARFRARHTAYPRPFHQSLQRAASVPEVDYEVRF